MDRVSMTDSNSVSDVIVLASLARQRRRIQDFIDLRIGEDVLFANQLENAFASPQRFGSELGGAIVADDGIQRGDSADA